MIELYAITDDVAPPMPSLAPLCAVAAGRLAALCGPVGEREPSTEQLWRREEIVEALMADHDVLPARYGTRFDDEATAARAVERRQDELLAALERVRGAVELSVRVLAGGAAAPLDVAAQAGQAMDAAPSGTAYMLARAGRVAGRRDAIRAVHGPLSRLARASVVMPPRADTELARLAYLVDRDAVDGFARRVARLQADTPELALVCTGPWPAYSFTGT